MSCEEFLADAKEEERHKFKFKYKCRITAASCIRFSLKKIKFIQ